MIVNIVMLVKDRLQLTQQAIRTLGKNTPSDLYNLTMIDDESVDDIYGIGVVKNWTMLKIRRSKGITGQARNLGIYWAEKYWGRGDFLYLTDNDVYFTPGWLDSLLFSVDLCEPDLRITGGWNHPFLQPKDVLAIGDRLAVKSHDAVTGASQLMRWTIWDSYGPLDAHAVGVGQSEDWAMCQKIIKDYGKVGSIYPRVVFNCGVTNSFGQPSPGADLMIQELQEAQKQYPDIVWR